MHTYQPSRNFREYTGKLGCTLVSWKIFGPDAHAFGLPVVRIVREHIVTLDLHELSAAKTATERSFHQDHH